MTDWAPLSQHSGGTPRNSDPGRRPGSGVLSDEDIDASVVIATPQDPFFVVQVRRSTMKCFLDSAAVPPPWTLFLTTVPPSSPTVSRRSQTQSVSPRSSSNGGEAPTRTTTPTGSATRMRSGTTPARPGSPSRASSKAWPSSAPTAGNSGSARRRSRAERRSSTRPERSWRG